MPVEFLTDEQAEAYGKFAEQPSRPELERFFFLDDVDRDLIALRRTASHQLGFAIQMCTVRYIGLFRMDDPLGVPWSVVEYLAGQLGIEDASVVKRYVGGRRRRTSTHGRSATRTATTPTRTTRGGGGSGGFCTGGRGRRPRGRSRCSTRRWRGCGATGCCCRE